MIKFFGQHDAIIVNNWNDLYCFPLIWICQTAACCASNIYFKCADCQWT